MEAIEQEEYMSVTGLELRKKEDALTACKKEMTFTI
jgi:hypothetical protein